MDKRLATERSANKSKTIFRGANTQNGVEERDPPCIIISSDDNDSNADENESQVYLETQKQYNAEDLPTNFTSVETKESPSQKGKTVFQKYLEAVNRYESQFGNSDSHNEVHRTQETSALLKSNECKGMLKGNDKLQIESESLANETVDPSSVLNDKNSDIEKNKKKDETSGCVDTHFRHILKTKGNKICKVQTNNTLQVAWDVSSSEERYRLESKHRKTSEKSTALKSSKQRKRLSLNKGLEILTSDQVNAGATKANNYKNINNKSGVTIDNVYCKSTLITDLEISSSEEEPSEDCSTTEHKNKGTDATTSRVHKIIILEEDLELSSNEEDCAEDCNTNEFMKKEKKFTGATSTRVHKRSILEEDLELSSNEEDCAEDCNTNQFMKKEKKFTGATSTRAHKRKTLDENLELSSREEEIAEERNTYEYKKKENKHTGAMISTQHNRSILENDLELSSSEEENKKDRHTNEYKKKENKHTCAMITKLQNRSIVEDDLELSSSEEESTKDRKTNKNIERETKNIVATTSIHNNFQTNEDMHSTTSQTDIKNKFKNHAEVKKDANHANGISNSSTWNPHQNKDRNETGVMNSTLRSHSAASGRNSLTEQCFSSRLLQNNAVAQKKVENGHNDDKIYVTASKSVITNLTFHDINETTKSDFQEYVLMDDDCHIMTKISAPSENCISTMAITEGRNTCIQPDPVTIQDDMQETQIQPNNSDAQGTDRTKDTEEDSDSEEEYDKENKDDDIPALEDEGELPQQYEASEISEEPIEPFYYQSQIDLANKIVERIKLIYHYYHKGKKVNSFKDFDFRIYTAKSNMLEKQTWARLCRKESGCLAEMLYEGSDIEARRAAAMRVYKYTNKTVKMTHDELLSEVKNNKDKLFLIVADEAHWGVTDKKQSNHKLVNTWNHDEHPNVIVLLVTATPYNLLSNNTRLPNVYYRYLSEEEPEFLQGEKATRSKIRGKIYKKLHHVKWSESFSMKVKRGIVVQFTVPQPGKEKSVRLCNLQQKDINAFIAWNDVEFIDTKYSQNQRYLIEGEENTVTVKTVDGDWILGVMDNKVGFMHKSKVPSTGVISGFSILTRFGEDIVLFKFTGTDNTEKLLYYNEHEGKISFRRHPPSLEDNDFEVPSPECSFILEHSQPAKSMSSVKEYLSLNYYLNSMRNQDRNKKLIRADKDFKVMSDALKRMAMKKSNQTARTQKAEKNTRDTRIGEDKATTDILTAEYSYYIIIINSIRECSNKSEVSTEYPANNEQKNLNQLMVAYPKLRKVRIKQFQENLSKEQQLDEISPIHLNIFNSFLANISDKALREFEKCYLKFTKSSEDAIAQEELVSSLFQCMLHLDIKDLYEKVYLKLKKEQFFESYNILPRQDLVVQEIIRKLIRQSETGSIVESLIPKYPQNADGKMKIIRVQQIECGNRMYKTLCIARKISSVTDYAFEILRDYGNATLCDDFDGKLQANEGERRARYRIRKRLQPKKCTYINDETYESCDCSFIKNEKFQIKSDLHCTKCDHIHKRIEKYTDLEGLPCILILVYKGRLGDTFPLSFDAMDLRLCYREKGDYALFNEKNTDKGKKNKLYLSSIIQEFGRLCRYQRKSNGMSVPYALVGGYLVNIFYNSLIKGAVFYSCLALDPSPVEVDRKLKTSKPEKNQVPTKCSFEHENTTVHHNRILLHAEPQIGKTGVYLKTISILQKLLCPDQSKEEDDSDEEIQYVTDSKNEEDRVSEYVGDKYEDEKHWIFPDMHFMKNGKSLPKTITRGKYVHMYGEYVYGKIPELLPESIISMNKRKPKKILKPIQANTSYKFKEHMPPKENSYRAYSSREHSSCVKCNIQYENEVFDLCFKRQLMDQSTKEDVKFRLSVPLSLQYGTLLQVIKRHTNDLSSLHKFAESYKLHDDLVLKSWIFIPTYNRPDRGNFYLTHTMVQKSENSLEECQYTNILVVRSTEFKVYSKLWKASHAILQIPDKLPGVERDVHEGSIGYARLAIQIFAESLKRKWIFLLDDNITYAKEIRSREPICNKKELVRQLIEKKDDSLRVPRLKVQRNDNGSLEEEEIPLFKLLKHLEEQIDGTTEDLETYTGPSSHYGVLGVKINSRYSNMVKVPFKKTHVYSLTLLNINKLEKENIYYKPWQAFEDITLNIECDDKDLWVCKYNRFTVRKNFKISWFPTVFYWDDNVVLSIAEHKKAENSTDMLIKWLRVSYPVKNVREIPGASRKGNTYNFYENMLEKLNNMKGRHPLIAIQDPHSEHFPQLLDESNSEEAFAGLGSSTLNCITTEMKEYFNEHYQVCTTNCVIIMLTRNFCLESGLISKGSLKSWLQKILNEEFKMLVVTSHNVKHFKMDIIIVVIEVAGFCRPGTAKNQIIPKSASTRTKRQRTGSEDEPLSGVKKHKQEEHRAEQPSYPGEREQLLQTLNKIGKELSTQKLRSLVQLAENISDDSS